MTTNNATLPDIEQLTRLANQLFTALPCDGSLLNAGIHAASPQAATATAESGKLTQLASLAERHIEPPVETAELNKLLANYGNSDSFWRTEQHADDCAQLLFSGCCSTATGCINLEFGDKISQSSIIPTISGNR